jgi:Zn-finger nucleic acid-binding protein
MTLKPCPRCKGEWFRKEVLTAVVLSDEPRAGRATPYKEMATTKQYSYICLECGFELP